MRFLTTALSLAGSLVCARISLQDAISVVKSERETTSGDRVFINPDGPLNIMLGHAEVNNDAIAKKRMFSPPIRTNYVLNEVEEAENKEKGRPPKPGSEEGRVYKYDRDPAKDEIVDCTGSKKVDAYLRAYYNTLKVLVRILSSSVVACTNHHKSFYKYTHVQLSDTERVRFFAALLLLANGEKIAAEYEPKVTSKKKQGNPSAVALVCGESSLLRLRLKIDNDTWTKPLYIEEVQTVVDFFVNHGATDVEEYGLHYTDSPGFLIRAYLCEYANDGAFISEVCDCVDAFLAETYSGNELDAARGRYFTADEELVREYSKQYALFTKIDEIYSRSGFPFTSSNMPLGMQVVHYFDEDEGKICNQISYTDCMEITLYNFFCCLLYDPEARKYSIDHLEANKCKPTQRFLDFFTKVCTRPADNSKACIHQEWACVAQGLTRPQTADDSAAASGKDGKRNMITYMMPVDNNVNFELDTDVGTFLMAMAKIVGLPETLSNELESLIADSLAAPDVAMHWENITNLLSKVIRTIVNPAREVDLELYNVSVEGKAWKCLYAGLELSFQPQEDDPHCYTFVLSFGPKHALFLYKPQDSITLSAKEREFISARGKETADTRGAILPSLICDCAKRFLSMADETLLVNEHAAGIESAGSPLMLYTALTRWLAHVPMRSEKDRLAAIDQVFPTFVEVLRQRKGPSGTIDGFFGPADPTLGTSNPVVILIANILGSVSLAEKATRMLFFQAVLANCVGERAVLFPSIRVHSSLYCPETAVSRLPQEEKLWSTSGFCVPNIAFHYLRQLAAIDPGHGTSGAMRDSVIDRYFKNADDALSNGLKVAGMFMKHKHSDGVAFVRGYCMPDNASTRKKGYTVRQ
ncbi:hypothetical protein PAPHI01_2591 [Pancytospora philotis]|nr:hypothetical protein PAPHI01_2591 [Pancytospora philotis]